ncbi:MAG: sialidase family protein, partial [Acidimicrobiales bacterium]
MHPTRTRGRIAALAVAAATTVTVLTALPPARAQTVGQLRVGENYRLGDPPAARVRDTPGLVANPADRTQLVHVQKDTLAQDCNAYYSTDAGATWTGGGLAPPPDYPQPGSPVTLPSCPSFEGSVNWGTGNNVYTAVGIAKTVGGPNRIIVHRSVDAGRTWTPTVAMEEAASAGAPKIRVHAGAGAGGADRVFVASLVSNRPRVAVSNNSGVNWNPSVEVSGLAGTPTRNIAEITDPVVYPNGQVALGYRIPDAQVTGQPAPVESTIQVARTASAFPLPGAAGWAKADVTRVRGYVDESGARFNGSNFPEMDNDPASPNLYMVYMEGPPPGGRQDHFIHPDVDTMFTRSTDGGATWSAPKRINDDPPGSGAPARGPAQRHP